MFSEVVKILLFSLIFVQCEETPSSCRNVVYHAQNIYQASSCSQASSCCNATQASNAALTQQVNTLQSKLTQLENQLKALNGGVLPTTDPNAKYQFYNYLDEIAQASCVGRYTGTYGWVYAVRRRCSGSKTCSAICTENSLRIQDAQVKTRNMSCFQALHLYPSRPWLSLAYNTDTEKLGLKVLVYPCSQASCGPNYCCCKT